MYRNTKIYVGHSFKHYLHKRNKKYKHHESMVWPWHGYKLASQKNDITIGTGTE